jgi:FkbM family methyltransferase
MEKINNSIPTIPDHLIEKVKIVTKSIEISNKNLFIDAGTNLGQGFEFFNKFFQTRYFDYLLIEPNPYCKKNIEDLINKDNYSDKIKYIKKAASIVDGKVKLYGLVEDHRGVLSDAATINKKHFSRIYKNNEEEAIEVECFDFIKMLKGLNNYDNIIIKLDIESSEYPILENLIKNNKSIKNICHIFVEFHARYMSFFNKIFYRYREKKIKIGLKKNKINFTEWV